MAKINADYLQQGMVLNSDVHDLNGRLLLRTGTLLTEKHLHIFKTWGITEADIQGVTKEDVEAVVIEEIDPVKLKEAEAEMSELFRHTDRDHPVTQELFRLCTLRKVGHGTENADSDIQA